MPPVIRPMTHAEEQSLIAWAAGEGWNPGRHDAENFCQLDPEGFLAIEVDGQLVGGGSIVRYDETFGFMGLFIVRPEFRGQQLGTQLWYARRDRLLSRLSPGATIGLDAVDAMIPFYERGGFRSFTRHRRFQLSLPLPTGDVSTRDVIDLKQVDLSLLAQFDRECFPAERARFLDIWRHQPDSVALAVMSEGRLRGYGVLRPCQQGWKIAPLFADDIPVAEQLLHALAEHAGSEPLFLDAPDNHPAAIQLLQKYGGMEIFGCVRMYLGPVPVLDSTKIFAITALEIG